MAGDRQLFAETSRWCKVASVHLFSEPCGSTVVKRSSITLKVQVSDSGSM